MDSRLTTTELQSLLGHDPQFIGVFPIDRLPRLGYGHYQDMHRNKTIKMIVNLEPNHLPGNHWVAIYRRAGVGFYFDSFGRPPPSIIKTWLSNNTLRWMHWPRMIQSPNDKTACGYICYAFLKRL